MLVFIPVENGIEGTSKCQLNKLNESADQLIPCILTVIRLLIFPIIRVYRTPKSIFQHLKCWQPFNPTLTETTTSKLLTLRCWKTTNTINKTQQDILHDIPTLLTGHPCSQRRISVTHATVVRDGLSLSVLGVSDCISDDVLEEDLNNEPMNTPMNCSKLIVSNKVDPHETTPWCPRSPPPSHKSRPNPFHFVKKDSKTLNLYH